MEQQNVELARHFQNNEGTLYEGESSDFRPTYFGGFEQETNNNSDQSRPYLNALNDVIINADETELIEKLSAVLNVDQFVRYWAIEGLIWHRDSYSGNANNYFLYADPNDGHRFHFLPWGIDTSMYIDRRNNYPRSILARGKLANRLMSTDEGKAKYFQELDSLVHNVWDTEKLLARITDYESVLTPILADEEATFSSAVNDLREWISGRAVEVEEEIADPDLDWDRGLRSSPCRVPAGAIYGSFSTTWDTLSSGQFAVGEASMSISLLADESRMTPLNIVQSGSTAGLNGAGRQSIDIVIDTVDDLRYRLNATFPDTRFFESYWRAGDHFIGNPPFRIRLTTWDRSGEDPVRVNTYELGTGEFSLGSVSSNPNGAISGTFNAMLYALGQ